jgi:NAD(P)-dependent dehydrogenase (short-subunit alcohol dehydrogenase family)
MRLAGKIALITGGNSGIGLASAKVFTAEGATVVITGRRQSAVDAAVLEIGNGALGVQGDVGDLADLDRLYAEIKARFGRLDIVFANAGLTTVESFENVSEDHFDREFNVNVKGVFFTVQKVLPLLPDGASIILTSSVASDLGTPGMSVYSATKAAVRSFARTWTSELKHRHIRVNCISPGPTTTPLGGKMGIPEEHRAASTAIMLAKIPMGRYGKPEEIANAALFLASDASTFITGIDLYVDGGMGQV